MKKLAIALVLVAAAVWLLHAVSKNELDDLKARADALDEAGRYEEALALFRQGAAADDSYAINAVGVHYHRGHGVEQDYAEAMRWYQRAAAQGFPTAMYNIGSLHFHGIGVEQDFAEALRWYRRGSDLGDIDCIRQVAQMHMLGRGVAQDHAEALSWYRKGMATDDEGCTVNVGLYLIDGLAGQRDLEEALRIFRNLYAKRRNLQFALREWQCLQDLGRGAEAQAAIEAAKPYLLQKDWFEPVARFVRAAPSEREQRELHIWVARGPEEHREGRLCIAQFYTGLKWLYANEPARAREALQIAAEADLQHPARRSALAVLERMDEH